MVYNRSIILLYIIAIIKLLVSQNENKIGLQLSALGYCYRQNLNHEPNHNYNSPRSTWLRIVGTLPLRAYGPDLEAAYNCCCCVVCPDLVAEGYGRMGISLRN